MSPLAPRVRVPRHGEGGLCAASAARNVSENYVCRTHFFALARCVPVHFRESERESSVMLGINVFLVPSAWNLLKRPKEISSVVSVISRDHTWMQCRQEISECNVLVCDQKFFMSK